MTKKVKCKEGSLFFVPLNPSGFALCVVARCDGQGRAFGYFFGPRVDDLHEPVVDGLNPSRALLVCKFGDHGIWTGKWPSAGTLKSWSQSDWPMPKFFRFHDDPTKVYVSAYDDLLNCAEERLMPKELISTQSLVPDQQLGSGIVETRLSKLLENVEAKRGMERQK